MISPKLYLFAFCKPQSQIPRYEGDERRSAEAPVAASMEVRPVATNQI